MMAAELALGLLDGEERAVALRRVLSDRGFAAEVEWWRRHLADLLDDYPSVPAPEGLIDRIAMASRPKPRSRLKTLIPAGLDSDPWGDLPLRVRDRFRNQGSREFPSRYREWIDAYYANLNRGG